MNKEELKELKKEYLVLKELLTDKGDEYQTAYNKIKKEFSNVKKDFEEEIEEEIDDIINSPQMLMIKGAFDTLINYIDESVAESKAYYEETLQAAQNKEEGYEDLLEEYLGELSALPQQFDILIQQSLSMQNDLAKALVIPGVGKAIDHILKTAMNFAYDTANCCEELANVIEKNCAEEMER